LAVLEPPHTLLNRPIIPIPESAQCAAAVRSIKLQLQHAITILWANGGRGAWHIAAWGLCDR